MTAQDAFWVNFINSPIDEFKEKYAANKGGIRTFKNQARLGNAGRAEFKDFFNIEAEPLAELLLDQNEKRAAKGNSLRKNGVNATQIEKAVDKSKVKAFKGESVNDILGFMEASDRHLAKLSEIYVNTRGDVEAVERAINPDLVSLDFWNTLPNKALAGEAAKKKAGISGQQRQQAAYDMLGNNEKIAKFLRLLPGINQQPGAELTDILKAYDMEGKFDKRRGDYNLVKSLQGKNFASIFKKSSPASRNIILKRIQDLEKFNVPGVDVPQDLAPRKDIAKALGFDEFMLDMMVKEGGAAAGAAQLAQQKAQLSQQNARDAAARVQQQGFVTTRVNLNPGGETAFLTAKGAKKDAERTAARSYGLDLGMFGRVGNKADVNVALPQRAEDDLGPTMNVNNASFMSPLTHIGRLMDLERDGTVRKGFFFKKGTAKLQPQWANMSPELLQSVIKQFERPTPFARGFVPNFSALGEIAASVGAGYKNPVTPSQVRSTNIPGLGKVNYNTQEKVVRAPGMQQPFIVPPRTSRAAPDYARKVEGKFGFNPYKSDVAAGGFVPNFQGLPNMDFTKFSESVTEFGEDVDRFAEAMTKTLEGQLNVNVDTSTTVDSAAIKDAVQNGVINAITNYFTSGPGVQNIVDLSQQVFNQNLG